MADGAHDVHKQIQLSGEPLVPPPRNDFQLPDSIPRLKYQDLTTLNRAPVGLQIVARKHEEEKVWAIAKIVDGALKTSG